MRKKERDLEYQKREKQEKLKKAQGKVVHHICHRHPLSPTETPCNQNKCFGCGVSFSEEDAYVYGCIIECEDEIFLHERCSELGGKIKHKTQDHILHQNLFRDDDLEKPLSKCEECKEYINAGLYYKCVSCCDFTIHMRCIRSITASMLWGYPYNDGSDDQMPTTIQHPSHPEHELRLLRRSSSFRCDACGQFGNERCFSYVCILCQYWIHEGCALLPPIIKRKNHHNHHLSVAFCLPEQYMKFQYKCDICTYDLRLPIWVYHCENCSYVVHIRCGLTKSRPATPYSVIRAHATKDDDDDDDNDNDVIQFPINDVSEELIRSLVVREGRKIVIPHESMTINTKYEFHNHLHQLSLILAEENNDIDDDYDLDHGRRSSELICDGCTTPIYNLLLFSSSSSSSSSPSTHKYYYYSCGECTYFLHLACFHLPSTLRAHPLHYHKQNLVLQSSPDLTLEGKRCSICYLPTNGLFYACTECSYFRVDVKCASLPNAIKHAAHPGHTLKVVKDDYLDSPCGVCDNNMSRGCYSCRHCKFNLHLQCALLPAANEHSRDKHPLPLTYDAYVNHPGEFYCDSCEIEMNPKKWMYHCRECDQSIHPDCFPATSGKYRNIKFGQQYVTAWHDHPLTYQLITRKRCCDRCNEYRYGDPGFQCASCNFVMCFHPCGKNHEYAIQDSVH